MEEDRQPVKKCGGEGLLWVLLTPFILPSSPRTLGRKQWILGMENMAMFVPHSWPFQLPSAPSHLLRWPWGGRSSNQGSFSVSPQRSDCCDQRLQRRRLAKQRALCTERKHQVCAGQPRGLSRAEEATPAGALFYILFSAWFLLLLLLAFMWLL